MFVRRRYDTVLKSSPGLLASLSDLFDRRTLTHEVVAVNVEGTSAFDGFVHVDLLVLVSNLVTY